MTIHPGGFVARPCDSACPENTDTTIYRCLRCPNPAWQPAPDIVDYEPLDPYARRIDGSATGAAPEAAVRGEAFARRVATGGPCAPVDPMYELIRRHSTGALARYVYGEDGDHWPDAQVVTFGEDD